MSAASSPLAVWKDLCIDAVDPAAMAAFWAPATGLVVGASGPHVSLDGATPAHRIWVNQVDRAHTVKNRLHLDIDCASVDDLVELGATLQLPASETGWSWSVMTDPEGNEFCAFVRDPGAVPAYRLHGIVIDSLDPTGIATWWGDLLGVSPVLYPEHSYASLEGAAVDERMTLDFVPVPEPRTVPHRVHWDLWGEAEAIQAAGATHLWDSDTHTVLADPEGNEFCVFAR